MKNQGEVLTVYFQVPPGRALVSVESPRSRFSVVDMF